MKPLLDKLGRLSQSYRDPNKIANDYPKEYSEILAIKDVKFNDKVFLWSKGLTEFPKCKSCNNAIIDRSLKRSYCSFSCRSNNQDWKDKVSKTANANGGLGMARKTTREKAKKTLFERTGVENALDIDRIGNTERACQTKLKKYGHRWHQQRGLKNLDDLSNTELVEDLISKGWIYVAEHFGLSTNSHSSAIKFIRSHGYEFTKHGNSILESSVSDFVKEHYSGEVIINSRSIIKPYELDIYMPEYKLAIEFNGLFYHSAGSKDEERVNYHLMKTEMCEEQGIHLFHIFENEWQDPVKREIWESMILHKLCKSKKIYARKCECREISNTIANEFIENNHMQGSCIGASLNYGLFYNDELMQVMSLGKPRYSKGYDYEVLRLCSLLGYSVVGGASKLLSKIDGKIVSYANRRWSYGNVYDKTGFRKVSVTEPCHYYIIDKKLYHRSTFMKHKLKGKLEKFDPNLTGVENCYANGLRRIWDCGNIVYSMN